MKKFIIISDIHSNWGALQQLEYIEEFKEESSHIIFAGDYIDGDEQEFGYGLKVLNYIIDLVEKNKATAILGNHDSFWVDTNLYNFEAYDLWILNGGRETLDNNGLINCKSFIDVVSMINSENLYKYTNFLSGLQKKFITDNILVVHAGIDWSINIHDQDEYDLLWSREDYIYPQIDKKDIPEENLKRVIVTGHTPTIHITGEKPCNIFMSDYPCRRYFIDGGSTAGKDKGQINVLILDELGNELKRYVLK